MPKFKLKQTRGKEMTHKIKEYLNWKIESHKNAAEGYLIKSMKTHKIQLKSRHWIDYKRHQEAQLALEKTLFAVKTIEQMDKEIKNEAKK